MGAVAPIIIALASIGGLMGLLELARRRAVADGWSPEVQRKLVHVATGLYALGLPFLFEDDWPVFVLIGLTLLVMAAMRFPLLRQTGAGALLHSVERRSYGDFMLAVAVGVVFLLSDRDLLLYILPLTVLTLGDAAAAIAGSSYGRTRFAVADGFKSLEGSAVLFLVTVILAMVCLLLLSDIARPNVVILAILIAGFSAMVEADSWRGFDNLFLPLAVLIVLAEHGTDPAMHLLRTAGLFALALIGFYVAADRLGASRHVARVYLAAAFLLLSVTDIQNAVLPLAMLAVHLACERQTPSQDANPALDAVAALAFVGIGWLAIANTTGINAIVFFGATTVGIVIALTALALARLSILRRTALLVLAALALVTVWLWLMSFNTAAQVWLPSLTLLGVANVAACVVPPMTVPTAFRHQRMLRITLMSAIIPSVLYTAYLLTGATL